MASMRTVGDGHRLPAHASVRADEGEYLVELDVSDFNRVGARGRVARETSDRTREPHGERAATRSRSAYVSGLRNRSCCPTTPSSTRRRCC